MSELPVSTWARTLPAYVELCKPRIVAMLVFTAIIGMLLASPDLVPMSTLFWGSAGIWLAAASAAVINHIVDEKADAVMARTRKRPLPRGVVRKEYALGFALVLSASSMIILTVFVNTLTAVLTLFSLIGYGFIYSMYLKRATPQNIVIGGVAGAAPPLLGWTSYS
jgi:protoheme IX farnesyltransferase